MDPLEVMLNLKQVIPYYQPVISADTQLIVGYEVLPLFKEENGNLKQLDWFFDDGSIPGDFLVHDAAMAVGKRSIHKAN